MSQMPMVCSVSKMATSWPLKRDKRSSHWISHGARLQTFCMSSFDPMLLMGTLWWCVTSMSILYCCDFLYICKMLGRTCTTGRVMLALKWEVYSLPYMFNVRYWDRSDSFACSASRNSETLNVKMNVLHLQTIEMLHRFVIEISLVAMTCSIGFYLSL